MFRIRPHRSHPMLVLGSSLLALIAGCGGEAPPQESGAIVEEIPVVAQPVPNTTPLEKAGVVAPTTSPSSGVPAPAALSARSVLETAFATADRTQRLVFLHSGADW